MTIFLCYLCWQGERSVWRNDGPRLQVSQSRYGAPCEHLMSKDLLELGKVECLPD
jgi:hypothetical protein